MPAYAVVVTSYDANMPLDMRTYQDPNIPKVAAGKAQIGDPIPWDKANYVLNPSSGTSTMLEAAIHGPGLG